jgi:hypothetical protein
MQVLSHHAGDGVCLASSCHLADFDFSSFALAVPFSADFVGSAALGAAFSGAAPPTVGSTWGLVGLAPDPAALEVVFLLHPTVPTPTVNAKPRINNPRSFCTVFPSFPQNQPIV